MKKLFCIAVLLGLCAFGGMAEAVPGDVADAPAAVNVPATEAPVAVAGVDAPYDGVWQPFEDGFKLYLPRDWSAADLTEAQREAGLFYRASNGDGAMGIAVGYMRAVGLTTVADLARDFRRAGFEGVARADLNGIPAIGFERARDNYRGVAFFHPVYPDYALYVYFTPLNAQDADSTRTGDALLSSIGPLGGSAERLKNN